MKTTLNELINEGYEVSFAYVASGDMKEWVNCQIESENGFIQGFGKDVDEALNDATQKLAVSNI